MREGLIPTILGTGVVATGIAVKNMTMKKAKMVNYVPFITAGVIGFGLAHILLGSIDLFENRE